MLIEAASTFWKKVKRSELLQVHAERHLEDMPIFFEALHPAAGLVRRALCSSLRLRHPVYDCLYLALAEREQAGLVTADQKLFDLAKATGVIHDVRLIA